MLVHKSLIVHSLELQNLQSSNYLPRKSIWLTLKHFLRMKSLSKSATKVRIQSTYTTGLIYSWNGNSSAISNTHFAVLPYVVVVVAKRNRLRALLRYNYSLLSRECRQSVCGFTCPLRCCPTPGWVRWKWTVLSKRNYNNTPIELSIDTQEEEEELSHGYSSFLLITRDFNLLWIHLNGLLDWRQQQQQHEYRK